MKSKEYDERVSELIDIARKKGKIKTYQEFLETEDADVYCVEEDDAKYYMEMYERYNTYNIGDIVFVEKYIYKNGKKGKNHMFVIVKEGEAVDINYFGFLLSSKLKKINYQYNEKLIKNEWNNLNKDSIVKCDDLIEINKGEIKIKIKIGTVFKEDIERFLSVYNQYLTQE